MITGETMGDTKRPCDIQNTAVKVWT